MKKALALLLSATMMISMITIPAAAAEPATTAAPTGAAAFTDTANHWGEKAIDRWAQVGVVKGDGGKFNPDDNLTRGALAAILTTLLGLTEKAENTYTDVPAAAWYADAVLKCTAAGIMKGDGTRANPKSDVSRQEAMVMLAGALGIKPAETTDLAAFKDAGKVASWAAPYVTAMTKRGIVGGVGNGLLAPLDNMTRASVVTVLDAAISDYITTAGTYDKVVGTGLVLVKAPAVILKNCKITGSLLVAEGVGNGDFTLDSTNMAGTMTVRGGGVNSIYIIGTSQVPTMSVSRPDGAVRVVTDGTAAVGALSVGGGKEAVVVEGKFDSVWATNSTPVTLQNADVKTVTATGKNADITVDKASTVVTVATAQENTRITVAGTATTVAATKEAAGVSLSVSKGGTATSVITAASGTVIKNDGTLGALTVAKDADTLFAKGENASKTNVTVADKTDLRITTIAAQQAMEAAAKAEADRIAADKAAAQAAADKAAAEKLAANAKSEAEKAAAAKAQQEAAAKAEAAQAAADKAAADKAAADKAQADSKKEADKVKEEAKVEEKPVAPPTVSDDKPGEVIIPDQPKPDSGDDDPSISEAEIDAIVSGGIIAVQSKVNGYAAVGALGVGADNNKVTVTIDKTQTGTLVATAYADIIGTLVTQLDASHAKISSITVEGKTLTLDGTVTQTEIHTFVTSIPTMSGVSGTSPITSLNGKRLSATVNTVHGQSYTYTIHFVLSA